MNTIYTGKFISELRKEKGLTQKELAEKLNVTDKAVSKWETGRSAPDIALLVSLADILGVTVVEILQGKKIEKESFPEISDEVVVRTIKKDNQKLKRSVFCAVIVMLTLIFISTLSYLAYHFFNSVPADDETAILKHSIKATGFFNEAGEDTKIAKSVKKGNYFFYLLQSENTISMVFFETDEIFENRISLVGGSGCSAPNEIELYCYGTNGITINTFYGHGMTDTEYKYSYRGVECIKPIKDDLVLDVVIDIDDSWTHANIIYDD